MAFAPNWVVKAAQGGAGRRMLHMTIQTAVLIETLMRELGAEVTWTSCNI